MLRLALILSALIALAAPAAAGAAPAAATISACRSDSLTVAGKLALSGNPARRARGATLEVRFQALPLFGLPRSGEWKKSGKKTRASSQEVFAGLSADSWVGVMSWRYKKGRRTVLSGLERSQPVRGGSSRGRASCTIAEGVKPVDRVPPTLSLLPADENWHHAPASVQLTATDDFSGVKTVSYAVDGGAKQQIANGGTFAIAAQGAHTVDWEATDVGGNTATRSAVVRVDAAPPTKPALSKPPGVTANTKPLFQWSASTDSGAGMKGYVLVIKRADGSIVAFQPVDANATSVQSAVTLNEGETYSAVVTAVDNTADTPWTTDSDAISFRVDSSADASFAPAGGPILRGSQKSTNFTTTLDRPADPTTVSPTTVKLRRGPTEVAHSAGCANSSCTVITVDPDSDLTEGRYVVSLNGVKSKDEGLTFAGTASYAVPYVDGDSVSATATGAQCTLNSGASMTATSVPYSVSTADAGTTAFLNADVTSSAGSWTIEVLQSSTVLASADGVGNAPVHLTFASASSGTIQVRITAHCNNQTGQVSATANNLFGSRNP
jgi:hypothetical protein